MQDTERQHVEIRAEFMKGNFGVLKSVSGFTPIAPDHGIEQENRRHKIIGGIAGITKNEKALDKFSSLHLNCQSYLMSSGKNLALMVMTTEKNTMRSLENSSPE